MPDSDTLPTLTKGEADWAAHAAALKARAAAASAGADPQAIEALLLAGTPEAGILALGGKIIGAPAVGHLMLIQQVRSFYAQSGGEDDTLAIAYALLYPQQTWEIIFTGPESERLLTLKKAVFLFSLTIQTEDLENINRWLSYHFGLLGEDTEGNAPGAETSLPSGPADPAPATAPAGS